MQYSVRGLDGNSYGPVDLATIKEWALEGRVLPTSEVTDHLSNRVAPAAQFEEFGIAEQAAAPPQAYAQYPRDAAIPVVPRRTKFWSILIWLGIAAVASFFYNFWPLWITGWNVYDAFRARAQKDPKADLCMFFGVGGFVTMILWSMFKAKIGAW